MKAISRYVAMCAIALSGLATTACTEDCDNTPTSEKLVLDYKIGYAITETRADNNAGKTEDGSDNLNENKIENLLLVGFDKDGNRLFEPEEIDPKASTAESTGYHHQELSGSKLTASMVKNEDNKFFLIANCEKAKSYKTLSELQAATISDANFQGEQKQNMFVMDATDPKIVASADGTTHFQFDLRRALAKIRLAVTSNISLTSGNFKCKLVQYAEDGNILSGDAANAKAGEIGVTSTRLSHPSCTQNVEGSSRYVFYSYANSWVDKNKNPNHEEPINMARQTYILLKAPYKYTDPNTGEETVKDYYYKVPVNKRLPENNDAAESDWATWEQLYRLDRNTIYDIKVTIDRPGGAGEKDAAQLTVTPTIQEWQDGGTYDYIDASTEVIFPGGEDTGWGYKVYYGQPQRGPMITLKDIDTKGKPWILQTDNPLFGFVECNADGSYKDGQSAENYKIDSYILNIEGTVKTLYFYVVPKNRLDMAQPHNVRAHVFLTKNPNERFVLNPDFKLKGCTTGEDAGKDIHFEQVL